MSIDKKYLQQAIADVAKYRDAMLLVHTAINAGTPFPSNAMPPLQKDFERVIRPCAEKVGLHDAGEYDHHGDKIKYANPVELAVKIPTFYHFGKAIQFLNFLIGRIEQLLPESETRPPETYELTPVGISVLRTLIEQAILTHSDTVTIGISSLRFRAFIPPDKIQTLTSIMDSLHDLRHIRNYRCDDTTLKTELNFKLSASSIEEDARDIWISNIIKRVLLSLLYQKYKKVHHLKATMMPLLPLAPLLEVSPEQLSLAAQELIDCRYIEYTVMDGGQYTCALTSTGATVARLAQSLLKEFPTVDMSPFLKSTEESMPKQTVDPRKVFVVHGRNEKARKAIFEFLRSIGLEPMEWETGVAQTQKACPYVGEVLDAMFKSAQAVVVLLTGDDLAKLNDHLLNAGEAAEPLAPQARPNVLFEAGMAFATHEQQTVIVEVGNLRPFSDIAGKHIIKMDGSMAMRQALADRLKTVGCAVIIEHRTDWHSAGDFSSAILPMVAHQVIKKPTLLWGCYKFEGETGLYCPACYENKGKKMPVSRVTGRSTFLCPSCKAELG